MNEHRQSQIQDIHLPTSARLPINRCNLPPQILGSLSFQRHPQGLQLDGVQALHGSFFKQLDSIPGADARAMAFKDFMRASFYLDRPDEIGLQPDRQRLRRDQADYLRMLRGWMFDPDGREAAVLKSWVESRFGLLPRYHQGPLGDYRGPNYQTYLAARSQGLYNTNALESQLDLLYTYCQYEIVRRHAGLAHLRLYRGINRIEAHDVIARPARNRWVLLCNSLSSFTDDPERADEFGDRVITTLVPLAKIMFLPGLLPDTLRGEQEFMVIGGLYDVEQHTVL